MQSLFRRHQKVRLLREPNPEYVEYYEDPMPITKGMLGKINIILPNGQYHVEILDAQDEALAYVLAGEDDLEAVGE